MTKYFMTTDNDGHWFVVPVAKKAEWNAWTDLDGDDVNSWSAPEWAYSIGGSPGQIEFEFPLMDGEPIFKSEIPKGSGFGICHGPDTGMSFMYDNGAEFWASVAKTDPNDKFLLLYRKLCEEGSGLKIPPLH